MNEAKEQAPAGAAQGSTKKDVFENYLLLGAPRAGKTTFFCCMADHLQTLATQSGRFGFKFCDNHTSRFIRGQMNLLRNGGWPEKSPKKDEEDYRFQLDYDKKLFGVKLFTQFVDIIFHDYPGEAYNDAFSDKPSGRYESDVEDLRRRIASAKGIFLMLDVKEIFNENNVDSAQEALVEMIRYLKNAKNPPKLALIFNKTELITNYSHEEYVRRFRRLFANAYQWLRGLEHKFFSVYTVGGECRIDKKSGEIIPPEVLCPRFILKPVNWMIHFI